MNVVFPAQAEYSYFSADFRLRIFLNVFFLRWLDTVCQGQYLPSLSVNYDAINKDLEKLTPQLY